MSGGIISALALLLAAGHALGALTLEVRIFSGTEEVTAETRVTVHRGGERAEPVAQTIARNGRIEMTIAPGIYDLQALRERDGRVLNIRWAERLVVMEYPDESGRHLEVINFTNGFGALQVRQRGTAGPPDAALYTPMDHDRPVAGQVDGPDYLLFIVPAGTYDVQTRTAGRATWHRAIEVPQDRTRLWFVP
jgi:hypothetical protein